MIESITNLVRKIFSKEQRRFIKFCIVGGSGVFVNLFFVWSGFNFIFFFFVEEIRKTLSSLFGIIISIFTNFLLNDLWTWADRDKSKKYGFFIRMAKFYLVSTIAASVQFGVYLFFTFYLNFHYLLSQLIGIAIATVINFVVNNIWTFKRQLTSGK